MLASMLRSDFKCMDQQLKKALELHKAGNDKQALALYERVLKTEKPPLVTFLNASSILRSQQKLELSIACLKRGIDLYPLEPGLWNNLGNCYLDNNSISLAVSKYRRALALKPGFVDSRISLASCLRELGQVHLAYAALKSRYLHSTPKKERERLFIPLVEAILALSAQDCGKYQSQDLDNFSKLVEHEVHQQMGNDDPARAGSIMTQLWLQVDQLDRALESREKLIEDTYRFLSRPDKKNITLKKSFHASWHGLSWNLAIKLLKKGRFKDGWRLYEHGLQVPAQGPQRWQRALKKPFTPAEVPLWRGESLKGKKLLLLGEQGIGDSMMFATLIPKLQEEGAKITLFPGERLVNIYRRSLLNVNVLSSKDLSKAHQKSSDFDYQSPLGSICQYRFHQFSDYGACRSFLKADPIQTAELRERYCDGRPLIGISWQGGGKADRIPLKSLKLKQLTPLLQRSEYRFVSLQYGDDAPHLERYRKATGIEVLHDDAIDPLRDMDGWLSQVAAMDAVISIANTTVHGAGGLGIPSICLVSQQSDWRWIDPEVFKGCYWYPSVDASYQDRKNSWQSALNEASNWLERQFQKNTTA